MLKYGEKNRCCLDPEQELCKEEPQGAITQEILRCKDLLTEMDKVIEWLSTKLTPILNDGPCAESKPLAEETEQNCNVARILAGYNCSLRKSISSINSIISRIEL